MFYDGRAKPEAGAIVCRVAPSFIRFGNFELPASRGDRALLQQLVDFTIRRDYPHLISGNREIDSDVRAEWFAQVCERTAFTVAQWMRVGFVHGVMNTDNMSILGLTIDYGPYGWVDNFDLGWTPNTTDAAGRRYRFSQQPQIAHWNLSCLAGALVSLFKDEAPLHAGLERFIAAYTGVDRQNIAAKLGFNECLDEDVELMAALYGLLQSTDVDMTLFFRGLADIDLQTPSLAPIADAFYDETKREASVEKFSEWLARYVARTQRDGLSQTDRRARMNAVNPRYVLRNYLAQQAIDRAEQGDYAGIHELLEVMRRPYEDQAEREQFAQRRPDWARNRAGCSMLSCSS